MAKTVIRGDEVQVTVTLPGPAWFLLGDLADECGAGDISDVARQMILDAVGGPEPGRLPGEVRAQLEAWCRKGFGIEHIAALMHTSPVEVRELLRRTGLATKAQRQRMRFRYLHALKEIKEGI